MARGRKGRREGPGETAAEPPPPVVVVPNIILCNVMLKIYGKTGRFAEACWMMDQVLLSSLSSPPLPSQRPPSTTGRRRLARALGLCPSYLGPMFPALASSQ